MGFVTHFINQTWEMKRRCLGVTRIYGSHNAITLGQAFTQLIPDQLEKHVSCVVTDNANNIKASIKNLEFNNVGCVAHTVQLCIQEINEHGACLDVINHCKDFVTHLNHSTKVIF